MATGYRTKRTSEKERHASRYFDEPQIIGNDRKFQQSRIVCRPKSLLLSLL